MYHPIRAIFIREVKSYFTTPIAYISMIIFLMMYGIYTFYIGMFFERGQADLTSFFEGHPWIYLIFIPTLTMRSWAEERKSGTIELLLTLPVSSAQAVEDALKAKYGKACDDWKKSKVENCHC